jgi:hypothetical protein
MTPLDRMLLLATCLLASYQIVVGIDKLGSLPIAAYTIGFGVLLVAALLLIILGFDVLESPVVVIVSTVIPLSLSLGLAWEFLASLRTAYLTFAILGFLLVIGTRLGSLEGKLPLIVLAGVHGISGTIIFLLPIILAARGQTRPGFALVGAGGALIGLAGILLAFERAGRPVLARAAIMKFLPGLLLVLMAAFVAGFKLG